MWCRYSERERKKDSINKSKSTRKKSCSLTFARTKDRMINRTTSEKSKNVDEKRRSHGEIREKKVVQHKIKIA